MKIKNIVYALVAILIFSCSKDDEPKLNPAKFSIDQSTVDFGEVEIPTQKEIKLTITNSGEENLILKNYTFSGSNTSEFTVNAGETEETVEAGKTYEFLVIFKPTETGDKTAILTITSNVGEHKINLLGSAILGPNAIVNIPDANFKASLLAHGTTITGSGISKIDLNDDGEIQLGEAQSYEGFINCYNRDVSDLTGIKAFVNITKLNIVQNQLTNLDVSDNVALEYLACDNNQLKSLNVSSNANLKVLWIQNNELTDLDVSQNTALEDLYLANNQLTNLDTSNNTALRTLIIATNLLNSIDVSNNTALHTLFVHNNKLAGLDVTHNTALKYLSCTNNEIAYLDVSKNIILEELSCDNNNLANLDLSQNTALLEFRCNNNQLSSLDVSKNTSLELLGCFNNQISNLDVSHNINLITLSCSTNKLSSLDVSQNTALRNLHCSSNQLTSLNVSGNPALEFLYCFQNQLTALNLANGNNSKLSTMWATNNPNLACIQIDADFTPPSNWEKAAQTGYSTSCQ
ncbi:choice-of-anchor D domain-containing protein [Tenacibaculum caenipelagi]|uniref:ASPM-SPD-2-Hydin domain-containing protein n=1 Tax=Tenacibaculum caenipelagi TaxID=1325435 RepID=A0A4R6TGF3_9FLAO|nr:choice-of-anchor D domain-containing protein [Tenacibaculum caenipelagi]TDQ24032.1 ASPM-SPD-2-Hydin domain-containing protein [Tenacibaculum caenipelagi]